MGTGKGRVLVSPDLLDPQAGKRRCELLVSLSEASFWLMDLAALRR